MTRYSGQIAPFFPSTAPLALRLPQAIYDESSPSGPTSTGPGLTVPAMGAFDSGGDAVPITGFGRPLRAMQSPVGRVAPAYGGPPSWVVTSRGLSQLSGTGCSCSGGMGDFDLSFKNPLVTGALVLAGLWFITKKSKR